MMDEDLHLRLQIYGRQVIEIDILVALSIENTSMTMNHFLIYQGVQLELSL
jgi:hypothetical protein